MEKVVLKLSFLALSAFMPLLGHSSSIEENGEFDRWFQELDYSKPKVTRFHFYFHDTLSSPGQTSVVAVAPPKTIKPPSTFLFGQINVFDNPLTKGPELTSELLGQAQGLYSYSSQEEFSVLLATTIVFTTGKHNGSSFTILGRNPVLQLRREFPIVGGTGNFRLARGFASASNYFANASLAIVEYNVTILHY